MKRTWGVLVIMTAMVASCCGSAIMREEMAAMAERECPNLLELANTDGAELSASEQRLIDWCRAQEAADYEQ